MRQLGAQCRQHEANLSLISDCLSTIEKDSTLSEPSNEALQKAQQHVRDSLNLQIRVVKMQNIGAWLDTSDFKMVRTLYLYSMQNLSELM